MFFPIAGVDINPLFLVFIGFVVGVLGGFFGVGGGFLAGPLLFLSKVPMNFVIGTDLAHMTGKSIVAAKRHSLLGHVDVKLGVLMILGTVPGIEIGAQIIELLKDSANIDMIIGGFYIAILVLIGSFVFYESFKEIKRQKNREEIPAKEALALSGFSRKIRGIQLPPMITLRTSGIRVSLWVIIGMGLFTGILAGFLGVGGGFIRMPALVYGLGIPTHIAIGTDLFEIIFSSGYGTLTHALKGNVDIMIALVMHTGAAIGAQIGASATTKFSGPKIRLAFSFLPFIVAALVLYQLVSGGGV